ncbi:hypothetical protein, partial [Chryseobacterium cucumeris]
YNNPVMFIDPDGRQNVSASQREHDSALFWNFDQNTTLYGSSWFGSSYESAGFGNNLKTMSNSGDGGGSGYYFSGNDAAKMLNYFKNGGTMSGLSFGDTEVRWWTGIPTQNAYRMGDDIYSDLDLGVHHRAKIS